MQRRERECGWAGPAAPAPGKGACLSSLLGRPMRGAPPTYTHAHYTRESIFAPRDLLTLGLPSPHPPQPLRFTDFSGFRRELALPTLRTDPAAPGQTCRSPKIQHLALPGPPETQGLPEEESGCELGSGRTAGEPWSEDRPVGSTGVATGGKSFPFQVCLLAQCSPTPHLPAAPPRVPWDSHGGSAPQGGGLAPLYFRQAWSLKTTENKNQARKLRASARRHRLPRLRCLGFMTPFPKPKLRLPTPTAPCAARTP